MFSSFVFCNKISPIHFIPTLTTNSDIKSISSITISNLRTISLPQFRIQGAQFPQILRYSSSPIHKFYERENSRVLLDTLRLLEWDKLTDIVASFAQTPFGRDAIKEQLSRIDQTYEESIWLLKETRAAVELNKYDRRMMNFDRIDVLLVKSAVDQVRSGISVDGQTALAVARLLQFADTWQKNIKGTITGNTDWHELFKPLDKLILEWHTNKTLVQSILQVINEVGSIKDSASPKLKPARKRVTCLNDKLYQLMTSLIANEINGALSLNAAKLYGRWCIISKTTQLPSLKGLLVSSGSGTGNIIEPVHAVPLNDELEEAEAYVAAVEAEVLENITVKIKRDLDGIQKLLKSIIDLDVVNARASYSISVGGTLPDLVVLDGEDAASKSEAFRFRDNFVKLFRPDEKQWKLHLLKAYHPLLLQRHHDKLQEARKDVAWATSMGLERYCQFRKKKFQTEGKVVDLRILQEKVTQLEKAHPAPVDFVIDKDTRVVLISGPNTGGKTVCLKTLGLAAIMAKAGLYVLCSKPAQIPWFDYVFADIGDQQSFSWSLSTFSGHLRQISDILAKSTIQSLVLLDEIGAGTNPQEGAALGMSILESFSVAGALLTVATTHQGDLKILKYCHEAFENACVEFDEVNLRPSYTILWGIPGRSNAINIAERLGLLEIVVYNARKLFGAARSEIDEVIYELEKFKKDVKRDVHKIRHYLMLSEDLHENLVVAQQKLVEAHSNLRYRKMQQIYEITSTGHSTLHKKMQEYHAFACQSSEPAQPSEAVQNAHLSTSYQSVCR